jgi:hypothetical protein
LLEGGQIDRAGQRRPDRGAWTAHAIKSGMAPPTTFHPVRATV